MRSPWREPQQSAGRRARPASRRVAQTAYTCLRRAPRPKGIEKRQRGSMLRGIGWIRLSALRSLFWCRGRIYFAWWSAELGHDVSRERPLFVIAGHKARSAVFAPDDPASHADRPYRQFGVLDSLRVTSGDDVETALSLRAPAKQSRAARAESDGVDGPRRHRCARMRSLRISNEEAVRGEA
jgi:hypothetical protein